MRGIIALISGFLFALGLGFSGMTQPHIVRGFLDVFGAWDWRLMGVMIGAIGIHAVTYKLIIKRKSPLLTADFHIPKSKTIDKKLIWGAIIFGLGWGWTGICPGPGIVSMISGERSFVFFVVAMLLGMKIFQVMDRKIFSKK
jgi:uncharacterized membrane protein YedE/YeeE